MQRRAFLLGATALALAGRAHAQASGFAAAARYSAERAGVSMLVLHRGRIVFEEYPNDGAPDRGWELASGTKSFTGLIAAAAAQDGLLDWDERAADTLQEWRSDARKREITIRDLLSLTSGIGGGPIARPPAYADAIAVPADLPRGERFQYGPTPFQIFGEIIRRKTNGDPLAYLTRRILAPLDIRPTHWRRGRDGNPHMPSGAGFTARDWSVFGQCVFEGGRGLVDRAALEACFEGTRANPGYGLSWWLLRPGIVPPGRRAGFELNIDNAEAFDIRMAAGAGNQRLYIVPPRELIIVRQAPLTLRALRGRGVEWSDADFLRLALS